jgi:hypothetical protein
VRESIELKRGLLKEEAKSKQQKTEARIKATQSFFQQQAQEAKMLFDAKMKETEKKRQEFERRREEEVAARREKADRKAQELMEVSWVTLCYNFLLRQRVVPGAEKVGGCRDAARGGAECEGAGGGSMRAMRVPA